MTSEEIQNEVRIADIIESRSPAGRNDSVKGWHNMLKNLLSQMNPHLAEGRLITFQTMKTRESAIFEKLHREVSIPPTACAVYMPPSIRFRMLYERPQGEPKRIPEHDPDNPPDEGIVLGCRKKDLNVVLNALLAKPPFTPAVDVYDDGRLLAGYVYHTIEECIGGLSDIFRTHLKPEKQRK